MREDGTAEVNGSIIVKMYSKDIVKEADVAGGRRKKKTVINQDKEYNKLVKRIKRTHFELNAEGNATKSVINILLLLVF